MSAKKITAEVLEAFLHCKHKAYLKLTASAGGYYRLREDPGQAGVRLPCPRRGRTGRGNARTGNGLENPPSLADAIRGGAALILDAAIDNGDESCRLDALERIDGEPTGPSCSSAAISPRRTTACSSPTGPASWAASRGRAGRGEDRPRQPVPGVEGRAGAAA